MKPKHQRLIFVTVSVLFLCISVLLVLRAFRDNLVFFYSPSDIAAKSVSAGRKIRLGGLVEVGSIMREGDRIQFTVSDGPSRITITYTGMLPNLFREGQGVVAEGHLVDQTHFEASSILAKHDENYMPREVVDALKRTGHWKDKPAP